MTTETTMAIRRRTDANLKSWGPGQSGNPAGRPLGSRHKLSEAFLVALSTDFQKHGRTAIEAVREGDPSTYLRVLAGLLPAKIDLDLQKAQTTPARTLEQVQAEISAEIERRAQELVDERMTVVGSSLIKC